ncbi:hypothetical protein M3Y98_00232700 [Aphelenchoides besseyi]|nr:hypothetical protein M3Y98_00232700 [Aphelenchoides besseyi]KAI6200603.1 hypothetical protein M3Y96_00751500 [Aphelenchoides besseyi]
MDSTTRSLVSFLILSTILVYIHGTAAAGSKTPTVKPTDANKSNPLTNKTEAQEKPKIKPPATTEKSKEQVVEKIPAISANLSANHKTSTKSTVDKSPNLQASPVKSDNPKAVNALKVPTKKSESEGSSHFFLYLIVIVGFVGVSYVYRKKLIGFVMGSRRKGRSGPNVRYRRLSTGENTIE